MTLLCSSASFRALISGFDRLCSCGEGPFFVFTHNALSAHPDSGVTEAVPGDGLTSPAPGRILSPSLKPQASSLKPQASSLKPQASSLKPQASSLKPQASSLKNGSGEYVRPGSHHRPDGSRAVCPPSSGRGADGHYAGLEHRTDTIYSIYIERA